MEEARRIAERASNDFFEEYDEREGDHRTVTEDGQLIHEGHGDAGCDPP